MVYPALLPLLGEVKPSVPCRSFTACKRSLNVMWKSSFRQNYRTFLAHSSTFRLWVLSRGDTWRRLVAKVGTSNGDRTISLKAAVISCIYNRPKTIRFWKLCVISGFCHQVDEKWVITQWVAVLHYWHFGTNPLKTGLIGYPDGTIEGLRFLILEDGDDSLS